MLSQALLKSLLKFLKEGENAACGILGNNGYVMGYFSLKHNRSACALRSVHTLKNVHTFLKMSTWL
jgi:hypothetical protein